MLLSMYVCNIRFNFAGMTRPLFLVSPFIMFWGGYLPIKFSIRVLHTYIIFVHISQRRMSGDRQGGKQTSWSRMLKKCSTFFISLVNKSEGFIDPAIWFTWIKLDCTFSQIAFPLIWRWRRPLVVKELLQQTHVLLSLKMVTGVSRKRCAKLRSRIVFEICCSDLVHSSVAYISASALLRAVMDWCLDT